MISAHFKTSWQFYFYVMFSWFIEAGRCFLVLCGVVFVRIQMPTKYSVTAHADHRLWAGADSHQSQSCCPWMGRGGAAAGRLCPRAQWLFKDPTFNTVILGVGFSEDEREVTKLWNHCPCQISDPGVKGKDFCAQEVQCWKALLALTS